MLTRHTLELDDATVIVGWVSRGIESPGMAGGVAPTRGDG